MFRHAVAAAITALVTLAAPAATFYVDRQNPGCSDLGPGTSSEPFCKIQRGYDVAADGDQVLVLPGAYGECLFLYDPPSYLKNVHIVAAAWVNAGDNTVTIIDGTLSGPCRYPGLADPASLVNLAGRGATGSTFQGFTVRGATFSGISAAGSVAITNNVLHDNRSLSAAGGIYIYTANCYFGDTVDTIAGNDIVNNDSDGGGGGIRVAAGLRSLVLYPGCTIDGDAAVTIRDNTIAGNTAGFSGGGMNVTVFTNSARHANVVITHNTITGNESRPSAGLHGYGGGIYARTYGYGAETVEIVDNTITGNTAIDRGGGVSTKIVPSVVRYSIQHRASIERNTVTGNTGQKGGGGLDLFVQASRLSTETVQMRAVENTITGNHVTVENEYAYFLPPSYRGGGGISAQLRTALSTSPDVGLSIERNEIRDNHSKYYGGGVSVRAIADGYDDGTSAPSRTKVAVVGNLIAGNDATSRFQVPSGGGAFLYLESEGEAIATADFLLNTLVSNITEHTSSLGSMEPETAGGLSSRVEPGRDATGDAQAGLRAGYQPAGLHVETFTPLSEPGRMGLVHLQVSSSIIADNTGVGFGGPRPSVVGIVTGGGLTNQSMGIRHLDVFGNSAGGYESWIGDRTGIDGNIAEDPSFVDPSGDFHLASDSPAIDAGDPIVTPGAPPTDLDGDPRVADGNGDGLAQVDMGYDEAPAPFRLVSMDIKPDSFPNILNPRSRGVIPVAILGSADFEVTTLDVTTLRFGSGEAAPAHDLLDPTTYLDHLQDVDLDGHLDLMTHYRTQDTGLLCGDTEATLVGETTSGTAIRATDSIETTGCVSMGRRGPWEVGERPSEPPKGTTVQIDRR